MIKKIIIFSISILITSPISAFNLSDIPSAIWDDVSSFRYWRGFATSTALMLIVARSLNFSIKITNSKESDSNQHLNSEANIQNLHYCSECKTNTPFIKTYNDATCTRCNWTIRIR